MVRSEGNMSLKNPVTPLGVDPGTFRLVAQRLNRYATPGPTVLNTVDNCKTVIIIIIQYYNLMGTPSYMRSVVDRNVVMRRIPVVILL